MDTNLSDQDIEQHLVDLGADAPRLSPELIGSVIVGSTFFMVPETSTTICVLILKNGFTVIGHSSPVSPANFNEDLGRQIAYGKAVDQIWALEGYLLKQKLYEAAKIQSTEISEVETV